MTCFLQEKSLYGVTLNRIAHQNIEHVASRCAVAIKDLKCRIKVIK